MTNSLDLGQRQRSVGPDLGPNCLQRLLPDNKIERVTVAYKHPLKQIRTVPIDNGGIFH